MSAGRRITDPDEALALVAGIRARNQRTLEQYEAFAARSGGLTGEGYSSDGTVRAEVDASGVVAGLDITDTALRRGTHLAPMILTAIREAQAARALRLAAVGAELGLSTPAVSDRVREAIPDDVRETVEHRDAERARRVDG